MSVASASRGRIKAPLDVPHLHHGQQVVLSHPARIKWIVAGRRWRKTTMCMRFAVERAIRGKRILWGAPTYDQCRIGWDELRKGCVGLAAAGLVVFNKSIMEAHFPGRGGRIRFRSMNDPDNARGYTMEALVGDEVPYWHERAWTEVLRATISDTLGEAMLVGTPAGRNWFWREWAKAQLLMNDSSASWQIPTKGFVLEGDRLVRRPHPLENPEFPESEAFVMLGDMTPAVFRQEFLAEFLEDELGVFSNIDELTGDWEYLEPVGGHEYYAGIDWGKRHDFTAITIIDATTMQVVLSERWNQIDYMFGFERIKAFHAKYKFKRIVPELNAMGEPMVELMFRAALPIRPFHTTNISKMEATESLVLATLQKAISLPNNPMLINEMKAFKMFRTPTGMVRYAAEEGFFDDMVMSFILAYYAIVGGEPTGIVEHYEPVSISAY